ncbi:MAG: DOMON domain-containing protein, partial [Planctomycetota bacterium]
TTGRGHAQQVITTAYGSTFTTYATPNNGRLYWVRAQREYREDPQVIEVFEKLADGSYALRADITRELSKKAATTFFWSDRNGDQKRDEDEIQSIPLRLDIAGQWWLMMEARSLTFAAKAIDPAIKGSATMKAFKVASYTACGAPLWDLENPQDLSYTHLTTKDGKKSATEYKFGHMVPSLDNKLLLSHHSGARGGGSRASLECFEMETGKRLWWYPKQWNHVHGGHKAPPAEPGLLRAAYGIIGQFVHPVVGNVWVINTDKGEWHMMSEAGFHIGNLFNPDAMTRAFPDNPTIGADMTMAPPGSGGEDFGGSVIQARSGEVYLQAGKVGAWRLALEGLDSIRRLGSGKVSIAPNEIALAQKEYERQKQGAASKKIMEIEQKTVTFTGEPRNDFGRKLLQYKKAENTRVMTWAAYDEANLYLAYTVYDPTPWVNGASEVVALYQCGDTVDLQLGTDPTASRKRKEAVKGDLRLSIGNFKGIPTAVLYRKVWDEKKQREFTSGVIKSYMMDYVTVLDSVRIEVKVDHKTKSYTVEAAVPLKDLGLSPDKTALYKADLGVTHGDPAGERTQLRTHWSNQQTGLVDDAVFELMMKPENWGEMKFK